MLSDLDSEKNIVLVSDVGMFCILDFGYELVVVVVKEGYMVVLLLGFNVVLIVLIVLGLFMG